MAYPDDITVDDDAIDAGTARSLKTISWLAAQLTPLLEAIRDNGISLNSYASSFTAARLLSSAATTNAGVAKASGGSLSFFAGYNGNAAARYLKFYNKASAPTVGTDTPVLTFRLPPASDFIVELPNGGAVFSTGIAYAITGAAADADTTAISSGDIVCLNIGTL
jgi:hypothetical protein